ncbi:hypothetical protein LCGC14_2543010 [marine sediment metagenome]|uniref:Uncharacterized protein n=1 Tax=marine sediment metagenome TaxID=412755 RepID=A0A0F9D1S3_9ZZZZ
MQITNSSLVEPGVYNVTVEHEGVFETLKIKPGFSVVSIHHLQRLAYNQMHVFLKKRNQEMQAQTAEARAVREKAKTPEIPTGEELEALPTMGNTKNEIQAYMKDHGIKYGANDKKKRLLRLISEHV